MYYRINNIIITHLFIANSHADHWNLSFLERNDDTNFIINLQDKPGQLMLALEAFKVSPAISEFAV